MTAGQNRGHGTQSNTVKSFDLCKSQFISISFFWCIIAEGRSLNVLLRENGFADKYDGGTKERTWDSDKS